MTRRSLPPLMAALQLLPVLTQMQAAERAGVTQTVISAIERGENTTRDTMRALLAVYGVSSEEAGVVLVGQDGAWPAGTLPAT